VSEYLQNRLITNLVIKHKNEKINLWNCADHKIEALDKRWKDEINLKLSVPYILGYI
jgi:hypothetical protein